MKLISSVVSGIENQHVQEFKAYSDLWYYCCWEAYLFICFGWIVKGIVRVLENDMNIQSKVFCFVLFLFMDLCIYLFLVLRGYVFFHLQVHSQQNWHRLKVGAKKSISAFHLGCRNSRYFTVIQCFPGTWIGSRAGSRAVRT